MNSTTVNSLGGFVAAVSEMRRTWRVPEHYELWFRAEDACHERTRLQPKLYRPLNGKDSKTIEKLLAVEDWLHSEFERCATQLCDVRPGDDWEWEWYFLMQHHGVPTRLLDWTDGSLIGLHFAVFSRSTHDRPLKPLVFVLDPYWINDDIIKPHPDRRDAQARWKKFCKKQGPLLDDDDWDRLYLTTDEEDANNPLLDTPKIPLLWDSPHVTRRVAAQRSRFMVFGKNPSWLSDLANKKSSRIGVLEVDPKAIRQIRRELRDTGITESVIFPDLDGLGRELRQDWEQRLQAAQARF